MRELGVEVATIDSMQGREKDITIISCVRANKTHVGFLKDLRRINVAFTRARYGCWIVGNARTLASSTPWLAFLHHVKQRRVARTVPHLDADMLQLPWESLDCLARGRRGPQNGPPVALKTPHDCGGGAASSSSATGGISTTCRSALVSAGGKSRSQRPGPSRPAPRNSLAPSNLHAVSGKRKRDTSHSAHSGSRGMVLASGEEKQRSQLAQTGGGFSGTEVPPPNRVLAPPPTIASFAEHCEQVSRGHHRETVPSAGRP